jgi:ubiquinone/menaquinone biosynthesis C-methylase UbiE
MDDLALLIDLHREGARQGPGGEAETRRAIDLSGLRAVPEPAIADIGCGCGASALVLARELNAQVTAVDLAPEFLAQVAVRAERVGLGAQIQTSPASMDDLPFAEGSLDAIWSEGAIYNMGFEAGVQSWRRFLKPGGVLAVTELTWLTADRPAELEAHWLREYAEVATASTKVAVLERHGYSPIGYFPLPEQCWRENYYRPLQQRFPGFLERHQHSADAQTIVDAEEAEISLYERFSAHVGYGFYLARRLPD